MNITVNEQGEAPGMDTKAQSGGAMDLVKSSLQNLRTTDHNSRGSAHTENCVQGKERPEEAVRKSCAHAREIFLTDKKAFQQLSN